MREEEYVGGDSDCLCIDIYSILYDQPFFESEKPLTSFKRMDFFANMISSLDYETERCAEVSLERNPLSLS